MNSGEKNSGFPPCQNSQQPTAKSYISWDEAYEEEMAYYEADSSDTGTVWFSESGAAEKILDFLCSSKLQLSKQSTSFLDLGTGNGELLFSLRREGGFVGSMLGIDYSAYSVALTQTIAASDEVTKDISFLERDILDVSMKCDVYDVVLDKGTFDAICLSGRHGVEELYREQVQKMIKPGGLFLITSCNWTEEELRQWLEGDSLHFHDKIAYPKIQFGGHVGQSITSICFRKGS